MRRWVLIVAVLLLAAAALGGFAVSRLNAWLAAHRDALAARASAMIGRNVAFDSATVSLRGIASIRIGGLRVADDPRYATADFLTADSAVVEVALLPALRGDYRLRRIAIDAPSVTLIRDAVGWNVDSLLQRPAPTVSDGAIEVPVSAAGPVRPPSPASAPPPAAAPAAPPPPAPAAAPAPTVTVQVDAAEFSGGTVRLVDRRTTPPVVLDVAQAQARVRDWAPGEPLGFEAGAAAFGATAPNISLSGTLTPTAPPAVDASATWTGIPLAALEPFVATLAGRQLRGTLGGTLRFAGPVAPAGVDLAALRGQIDLQDVEVADPRLPVRLTDLTGTLQLTAEAFTLANATARVDDAPVTVSCRAAPPASPDMTCQLAATELPLPQLGASGGTLRGVTADVAGRPLDPAPVLHAALHVRDGIALGAPFTALAATATLAADRLTLTDVSLDAFAGSLRGSGVCRSAGNVPACDVEARVTGMDLRAMLASQRVAGADRIEGRLDATATLTFSAADVADVRRTLRGGGPVSVHGGVVHSVNLAQRVLGSIPGIGGLAGQGTRAGRLLGDGSTRFDELGATLRIDGGRVSTDDAVARSADYSVDLHGSAGFAGDLDFSGVFRAAPPLVNELLAGVPVLGGLARSTRGAITVPFTVTGTLDAPQVEPNLGSLAGGLGRDAEAGLDALFGKPDPRRGKPGGVVRREFDRLFGR